MLKKGILLLFVTTLCLSSICTNITMGYYTYDLSYLSNLTALNGYSINLCNSLNCLEATGYQYTSFITKNDGTNCVALTPGSQLSEQNILEISSGLSLNYPRILKYSSVNGTVETNTTVKSVVNITCNKQLNQVQSAQFDETTGVYTFMVQSTAGCSFQGDTQIWQYFTSKSIIFAIVFWIVGLYSMFLGYFLIRVTIMIYGFITAAGFSLIFFTYGYPQQAQPQAILNWMLILSSIFGVFYGFFLITLPRFGYFNIGVWFGVIICLLLQNAIFVYTKTLIPFYVCLGVICFVCGVAGIMGFKYFIIVSTSLISGFLLIRPLGFYLPYYPNQFNFYKLSQKMPWQYYLYMIAILILFIIGVIFQSWLFRKRGRKDKLFHLQDDTDIKTKFKNLLQFKQIKDFFHKGTNQFKMLKNLVTSKRSDNNQDYSRHSEVEQYPKQKQTKGKYKPPSVSDEISPSQQSRSSASSIEMVEIKKKNQPPPKATKKNR